MRHCWRRRVLFASLCVVVGASGPLLTGAEVVLLREAFAAAGGAGGEWEFLGGVWRASAGGMLSESASGRAFAYAQGVPEVDALTSVTRMRVQSRTQEGNWSLAGATLFLGPGNFWQLALVEGPDGRRYAELIEMLEGTWQAQRDGATALEPIPDSQESATWNYGHPYLLRLESTPNTIVGEVLDAASGERLARLGYRLAGRPAVRAGRPGCVTLGMRALYESVEVRTTALPREAAAGSVEQGPAGCLAILDDDIAGLDRAYVRFLSAWLRERGFGVTPLTVPEAASTQRLDARLFDAFLLTASPRFPADVRDSLLRFLRNGGDLVLLGGNAFADPVHAYAGRWLTRDAIREALAATPPETTLFDFEDGDATTWERSTNHPERPSRATVETDGDGHCLALTIRGLEGWDTFRHGLPDGLPAAHNVFRFRARGDRPTSRMAVELAEADGSRWIAVVETADTWRTHALAPADFGFWRDSRTPDRGGPDDRVRFADVRLVSFGVAFSHTGTVAGDCALRLDDVGTSHADIPPGSIHEQFRLNVFSDYAIYDLRDMAAAAAAEGPGALPGAPDVRIPGPLAGTAAIGFPFPNESVFYRVLEALDSHGRPRGPALGLLVNYRGTYRKSSWLLAGITSPAFYRDPGFLSALAETLGRMRGNSLAESARRQDMEGRDTPLPLTTAPPHQGFLRLSPDGRHIVYPDGRRFFMIGCNYVGSFDRCGGRLWRDEYFDVRVLEDDFRKARDAGLNIMRYWLQPGFDNALRSGDARRVAAIRECARRYGVYLLLDLPGTGYATEEEMLASHRAIAAAFRDEPMVLGYDLRNEPYVTTLGGIRYAGEKPPVQTVDLSGVYPGVVDPEAVASWLRERPWWLHLPAGIQGEEARRVTTNWALWSRYTQEFRLSGSLPGIEASVPVGAWGELVRVVNDSLDLWLRLQIEAIREVDPTHLITVGHNTNLCILPANQQLDFVSKHVYVRPFSHENVRDNLATLDRLARLWPDKPITLGEFGYSNGIPMPDGALDLHTSAVGEMIHFLYALTSGCDGCKKWMLVDWPLAVMIHYGDWNRGLETRIYEERFGLYAWNGNLRGHPKPIVHAVRCLREYVDRGTLAGELDVLPGNNPIGTAYRFRGQNALFVGDVTYDSKEVSFTAGVPANVLLLWDGEALRVTATADAVVRLRPGALVPGLDPAGAVVSGRRGALRREGEWLVVEALEGETLRVGPGP
ncbi:MAG: hypothetical protein JXR77_10070 [Lentisphaeria bacterium]|nr:hypothetical protein [Lentisphaeria bacterium]